LYDIADILAFEDRSSYVYVAGDCTRAYSGNKMDSFTRQIVFLRPDTFVIFDRVCSKDAGFKKTWLLQAMKVPAQTDKHLVITNGKGRLFVQTLLPERPQVKLVSGPELYSYGGRDYPSSRDTGPAPECRIEISPSEPGICDYFLHVLTASESDITSVEEATLTRRGRARDIMVSVGTTTIKFAIPGVGGSIEQSGQQRQFADAVIPAVSLDE